MKKKILCLMAFASILLAGCTNKETSDMAEKMVDDVSDQAANIADS